MVKLVGTAARFMVHKNGWVCQNAPMDGSLYAIDLEVLRQAILHNGHYAITAGHLDTRHMVDELDWHFYWPDLAVDVYKYEAN